MSDWSKKQAAEAVKRAKAHWGTGWANLSADMQQAYIAREVLTVLVGQDEDGASPAMLRMIQFADLAMKASS